MKQLVLSALGLLAGLVGGVLLVPQPVFAEFALTHVTWDGSACPTGEYTITSTASDVITGEAFQATSEHVRLPVRSVSQDFPDLPPGTYTVTARSVDLEGTTYLSDAQTVTIAGTSRPALAPIHIDSPNARHRPASSPSEGVAHPRVPEPDTGRSGSTRHTGQPDAVRSLPSVGTQVQAEVSLAWALQALDHLTTVGHGGGSVVRDVAVVDEDGDGTVDYVRAAIGGRVLLWRIVR